MIALFIIGLVLIFGGMIWNGATYKGGDMWYFQFWILMTGIVLYVVYVGIMSDREGYGKGYKQGQSDYVKGKIEYKQVIKSDTTYVKLDK